MYNNYTCCVNKLTHAGGIVMNKCKICGKKFEEKRSLYLHVSVSYSKEKEEKHCPTYAYMAKYEGDKRLSKSNLKKMYFNDKQSTPMISEEMGVNKGMLIKTMHYYGFSLRSISEATINQIKRDGLWNKGKTKNDHPSIMKYAKAREGKNNPFYTAPGYEERYKKFVEMGKRGVNNFCANRNPKTTERRMSKILDDMKLSYVRNFSLNFDENGKIRWRLFDFLIENILLIEMNGNYFHANPRMYKKDDEIVIHSSKKKASDIWAYDAHKIKLGKDNGYKTITLWEDEFVDMTDKEVVDFIMSNLKQCIYIIR